MAVTSAGVLAGLVVLVVILDSGLVGAVAATGCGMLLGGSLVVQPALLRRPRLGRRGRAFLKSAVPYGLRVEAGYLMTQGAARLDLLVVFALSGTIATGVYSVALTIGILIGVAPAALA